MWVFGAVSVVVISFGLGASLAWLFFTRLQRPFEDSSQEQPERSPQEGKADEDDPNISPDFRILVHAIRNQATATRQEYRREDRRKTRREWITIVLVVLTLGTLALQVREMVRVYDPIKEQADAAQKQASTSAQEIVTASRAWVGPLTATLNAVQKDKGFQATVQYQNTGREPATDFLPGLSAKIYSLDEWNKGTAAKEITSTANQCMKVSSLPPGLQVIYPNTGFSSYQDHVDTGQGDKTILATDSIIAGKSIFALQGCFTYKSIGAFHHSAFCYYYQANVTTLPNMNICNVGSDAD